MIKIGVHYFIPGSSILFRIGRSKVEIGKIWFPDTLNGKGLIYICHNSNSHRGTLSPNMLGFNNSWAVKIDTNRPDDPFNDELEFIEPIIKIDPKSAKFSEDIVFFLKTNEFDYLMPIFEYKIGIFDEYSNYSISEKLGYIILKNDKKFVEIKISRFIRQMALKFNTIISELPIDNLKLTDKIIESIYNKFVAFQKDDSCMIKFLQGENLLEGYTSNNYYVSNNNSGTLYNSCMNNKLHFLNIYTKNPNKVKLAVIYIGDKIAARCLVWNTIDGKQYSDRIYYTHDWLIDLMSKKLAKMGINSVFEKNIKIVQLDEWKFGHYPYLDNFYNFDLENGTLLAMNPSHILRNTDGRL